MKTRIAEHMDSCEEALDKSRNMVRRSLPLHRKVKNMYMKNRVLQVENMSLKGRLHQIGEEDCKEEPRPIGTRNNQIIQRLTNNIQRRSHFWGLLKS
jgi:regulator of replication initiation timing